MSNRVPPHAPESEDAVLGACMIDRDMVPIAGQHLDAACFYAPVHETIWRTIQRLYDAGQATDKITVATDLRSRDRLEKVGGLPYLNRLLDTVQDTAGVEYHAKIVREKAVLRELIRTGYRIVELGFEGEYDPRAAVDEAEQMVRNVGGSAASDDMGITAAEATLEFFREINNAASTPNQVALLTPWRSLNNLTGGFFPGEMSIWPAAAKMGKSAALNTMAWYTAEHDGLVLYFVLEMGWRNTNRRMLGTAANLTSRALRKGDLKWFEWDALSEGMRAISGLNLRYFNRSKSVADIRRVARRLHHNEPVKAIIVDHIAFLDEVQRRPKGMSENDALNFAYVELLNIAEEIGCVVHVAAHINREGMKRGEPTMADIRGGGNPEGHAHVIISPYRADPDGNPVDGKFIILANREGDAGGFQMAYEGPRLLWRELRCDEDGQRPRPLWFEERAA